MVGLLMVLMLTLLHLFSKTEIAIRKKLALSREKG